MFGNISLGPCPPFARLCVIHWGLFAPAYPAKAKDPLWSGCTGSVAPSPFSASIADDMCLEPSSWIATNTILLWGKRSDIYINFVRAKKGRHVIKQEIQGVKLKSLVVTWILKSIFEGKKNCALTNWCVWNQALSWQKSKQKLQCIGNIRPHNIPIMEKMS